MNIVERTKLILKLLQDKDYMMVDDIAELTGVSKATIRRDLQDLEKVGKVRRFHGGVSLNDSSMIDNGFPIAERMGLYQEEKESIARYAAEFIKEGDVVYLDGGSTVYCLIDHLHSDNIKIVTNSLYAAVKLAEKGVGVYILGGDIISHSLGVISQDTIDLVKKLNFDIAFLGTSGIDIKAGLSSSNSFDATLKSVVMERSNQVYVLADHSKFGIRKLYTFAELQNVSIISSNTAAVDGYGDNIIFADPEKDG